MQLSAIKIQSCSDIITNSSSELFQLRTDESVEQIKETLDKITSGYIGPILFNLEKYRKNKYKFVEIVKTIDRDCPLIDYYNKRAELIKKYPEEFIMHSLKGYFFDPEYDTFLIYKYYLSGMQNWNHEKDDLQLEFEQFASKYIIDDSLYLPYNMYNIKDKAFTEFIESHKMPDTNILCERYNYGSIKKLDGCILIISEDDNSIPYETWDTINSTFKGINYHLG